MSTRNYWGYRIGTGKINFFKKELEDEEFLRQGWGWEGQDLRNEEKLDKTTRRNLRMKREVKKGDILLVPRLPTWREVAIVEATEDWDTGYEFKIVPDGAGDFGHKFPAKKVGSFVRNNQHVTGNIRSTLRNPGRFWSINHLSEDVETLLKNKDDLEKRQSDEDRLFGSINSVFSELFEKEFNEKMYEKLNKEFNAAQWEFALVAGLQKLFPFYSVEKVGGMNEKEHGTDILIKIPSLLKDSQYAIAIQVKDWEGFVSDDPINQISKAKHWENQGDLKLIDKIVIITKAKKEDNLQIENNENVRSGEVKVIFGEELKELLSEIAKKTISLDE